jgi:multicomponent Na+:H+ antiporter subunit C
VRVLGLYNYWVFIFLMMVGFYILISRRNLVKKILGLNIFQTSVFIFYISMGKITGGTAPILLEGREGVVYSNPLPHVLILTAIVVGVSTTAVALSLVVRIKEAYGTIEGDEVTAMDNRMPPP